MRTTIDLPDELFKAAKLEAIHQGTSLKDLITDALRARFASESGSNTAANRVRQSDLGSEEWDRVRHQILARIGRGYHLGGRPLTREEAHERQAVH